jgi:single-stranded-DNA-specific exonuclease
LSELHDPELLPGVPDAADRLVSAIQARRRITIYGDYDVDGVTATSLLWHCLKLAGAEVDYYVPHRLEEGYGLNCDAIRKLHAEDPRRLLVSVDCGIASIAEAALARELGLELIITDHHNLSPTLPAADCLVHPRLPGTTYPFGDLCGVGVAFKLAWGVCQRLGDGKKASPRMREFLMSSVGLAAIGTVADVVPLLGENRVIVRYGLSSLRERCSIGLKALMTVAELNGKSELQSEDIGFALAPRINAAGRLGQARLAVELLTTESAERAKSLADYIDQLNKDRQTVERKVLKQAKELVEEHPEWEAQAALVLAHPEWHAGVIGIVANRVAEHFQKPTVMIAVNREDGLAQGSCRTFANFDLYSGLAACSQHLASFGGHHAAAGLKVQPDRIDGFRDDFCRFVSEQHEVHERDLELQIDAEVQLADLTHRAVTELDRLGPFGRCNPRPVFASTHVELAEPPRKMGGGDRHLSLVVRQRGKTLRAVSFGHGDWADEMAAVAGPISISFAPCINRFRGQENVEIQLTDWKPEERRNIP